MTITCQGHAQTAFHCEVHIALLQLLSPCQSTNSASRAFCDFATDIGGRDNQISGMMNFLAIDDLLSFLQSVLLLSEAETLASVIALASPLVPGFAFASFVLARVEMTVHHVVVYRPLSTSKSRQSAGRITNVVFRSLLVDCFVATGWVLRC